MFQMLKINDLLLKIYLKNLFKIRKLLLFCLFSLPVLGQDNLSTEYKIEVIVFEQVELIGDEKFQPKSLNLNKLNIISLLAKPEIILNTEKISQSFQNIDVPLDIELIDIEKSNEINGAISINETNVKSKINTAKWYEKQNKLNQLDNIYRRLDRRKEYRILHKASWLQPALAESNAPFIHEVFNTNGVLIKLYQSRYLHLEVLAYLGGNLITDSNTDLVKEIKLDALQNSIPEVVVNQEIEIDSTILVNDELFLSTKNFDNSSSKLEVTQDEVSYLLKEERRIFKNESHYFDHPKLGVIISVYDSSL